MWFIFVALDLSTAEDSLFWEVFDSSEVPDKGGWNLALVVLLFNHTETDADIQPCLIRPEGCHTFPTAPDFHDAFCLFHVTARVWEECHLEPCHWQWDTSKYSWHIALSSWMCSSAHNEWERKGECYRRREGKETRPQRGCGVFCAV